jgi:phosphoglycolate phosphatase-like HAD superfamily hydrolase
VRECLDFNGVLGHFDFIHSATNLFGKHRVLRHLLRKQRLSAKEVFYVGDEARDIEASKKCGIPVVAVGWGFQSIRKLRSMNPDYLAQKPSDIVKFVVGK